MRGVHIADTNRLVSEKLVDLTSTLADPTPTLADPTPTPADPVGACIGHEDFMMFVSNSFALGSQRERFFQWHMGF